MLYDFLYINSRKYKLQTKSIEKQQIDHYCFGISEVIQAYETYGGDGHTHYQDCHDGFLGAYVC